MGLEENRIRIYNGINREQGGLSPRLQSFLTISPILYTLTVIFSVIDLLYFGQYRYIYDRKIQDNIRKLQIVYGVF
jgi:hypothetical protein